LDLKILAECRWHEHCALERMSAHVKSPTLTSETVEHAILLLRGHRVMLDEARAEL
jgi:hypothetical protein